MVGDINSVLNTLIKKAFQNTFT